MSPLTYIIASPLVAALLVLFIPRNYRFIIRTVALLATFLSMVLAVKVFIDFSPGLPGIQFEEIRPWVSSLGINYHVGVDGLNVALVLLAGIVAFAATCVSRDIKTLEKEFYLLLLVMAGGIIGAFASLDLFFFYFFHELALVPTFIMIGVWGRGEKKNYATFQITLYLSLGALIALAGLILLYVNSGIKSFDMIALGKHFAANPLAVNLQNLIFPFLLFGFGILVSLWPFHTWAPLGYGSAPTATAMLHAGVLKKFGVYGLIRIALPWMPEALRSWADIIALLCVGNIVYCGLVAMRQRDLNLLIGNSSVAHMGFVFLGIASFNVIGVTGAVVVMVAHGFLAALTFALSGYIHKQAGTLDMDKMGGFLKRMPFVGAVMVMAMMAGCGLPGFANFAGESLVLFGSWSHAMTQHGPGSHFKGVTVLAIWGALVIGAVYMLRAIRCILHGPESELARSIKDAGSLWAKAPYALLVACLLVFGFVPGLLIGKIQPVVKTLVGKAPATLEKSDALKQIKTTASVAH